jgi:hypothetical protein
MQIIRDFFIFSINPKKNQIMSKKVLIILGIMVAATMGVVIITQPGLKKGDRVALPGIAGQESVYYRVQLKGTAQVADYMSKGVAKMSDSGQNNVTAEALPVPITDDIAKSFPGYKIKSTTMVVAEDVTTYEVVIVKGSKTKTLFYEVYETLQAAQESFIVSKRVSH